MKDPALSLSFPLPPTVLSAVEVCRTAILPHVPNCRNAVLFESPDSPAQSLHGFSVVSLQKSSHCPTALSFRQIHHAVLQALFVGSRVCPDLICHSLFSEPPLQSQAA